MSEQQNEERRRTLSCSGNLGIYVYLHDVENMEPDELTALFHEKAEAVRHYAMQIFDDAEEDAEVGEMWDGETGEEISEEEYYR